MAAAVTGRSKVILLCTPNNPTGVRISHGRIEAFLQSVRSDVLVVIDEAYLEYADAGSGPDSLALYRGYPNVCILRTFSKTYGLAGLRFGYAITTAAIAEGLRRTTLPFAVSALAQTAAIASLDAGEEMETPVAAVRQERARMAVQLEAQGWKLQPNQGNFLWIRAVDRLATLKDAFDGAGIMVRAYQGDGVRITVADAASNDRVLRLLEAHAA
ncbi:aminotransferase class I/II-fold pyridoxal phosphate-dependent enzyme [Arthrobacter sp. D3-16]